MECYTPHVLSTLVLRVVNNDVLGAASQRGSAVEMLLAKEDAASSHV